VQGIALSDSDNGFPKYELPAQPTHPVDDLFSAFQRSLNIRLFWPGDRIRVGSEAPLTTL